MARVYTLTLIGPLASRERAKLLLENQPKVRRVDAEAGLTRLRLFLSAPMREDELLPLLEGSGLNGFALR